jgi:hypothetical protein
MRLSRAAGRPRRTSGRSVLAQGRTACGHGTIALCLGSPYRSGHTGSVWSDCGADRRPVRTGDREGAHRWGRGHWNRLRQCAQLGGTPQCFGIDTRGEVTVDVVYGAIYAHLDASSVGFTAADPTADPADPWSGAPGHLPGAAYWRNWRSLATRTSSRSPDRADGRWSAGSSTSSSRRITVYRDHGSNPSILITANSG